MLNRFASVLAISTLFLTISSAQSPSKFSPRLQNVLRNQSDETSILAWVYFQDKGPYEALRNSIPQNRVTQKSLARRSKVRPANALVDYTDLPVAEIYIEQVASRVIQIRQRSRWFNGVSVNATPAQLAQLEQLSFVTKIEPVARFAKNSSETEEAATESATDAIQPPGVSSFDYGTSFNQNNQINVVAVHDLGNYGQGVVVAVFDNGFRLLTHEAFDTLETRTIATYDFVDHKVSVVPNNPAQGAHGVNTLSTIGGFRTGQLIGPAFGATYILGRTENDSSETPIEEDNWVAAIEWADSIGVDVTSTSLGYIDYDSPYTSWTWEDMDGNTTVITRAGDMAVERGIIVVNSAGNEGFNASHNTLGAPADGDSVFSIGSVTSAGVRSSFSSVGPTTSIPPRTKPDVMARGSSVRVASSTNPTGYTSSSGTSFSCPLAAGVVALMVHARPSDTPIEIMDALRSTASQASSPSDTTGWGIINAIAALSPSPVSLVSPANSASDIPLSTQLTLTSSKWATSYQVQVSTNAGFSTTVFDDSTLTDTTATVSGLLNGTTYYWRARAKNLYGWSPFSSTNTFNTSSDAVAAYAITSGWNLVALAVDVPDGSTSTLFPDAVSNAFRFGPSGYESVSSLDAGSGYWLKFGVSDTVTIPGVVRLVDTVAVLAGWNLIGGITNAIDTSNIIEIPNGIVISDYFGYSGAWAVTSVLEPGIGYWVKVSQDGLLILETQVAARNPATPGRKQLR